MAVSAGTSVTVRQCRRPTSRRPLPCSPPTRPLMTKFREHRKYLRRDGPSVEAHRLQLSDESTWTIIAGSVEIGKVLQMSVATHDPQRCRVHTDLSV